MELFKSGNPALKEKYFQNSLVIDQSEVMTERGTLNKFGFTFLLLLATSIFTWNAFYQGKNVFPWIIVSAIAGLVLAFIIAFRPRWASYLVPVYGLVEGVFVGGVSAFYNFAFAEKAPGIVMQAVGLTFGVVIAMYLLYRFRIIKATKKFKAIVLTATLGIALFYVLGWLLRMFGMEMPLIHESTTMGIGLSLVIVAIAALNLIIDFDMIENGVAMGAPKYMEWYGAFGLLVTIVWLYIEILRLLSKFASRK